MNGSTEDLARGGIAEPAKTQRADGAVAGDGDGSLADPARLRALVQLGLTTKADPHMEDFAQWVRDSLGVPVALVSLVTEDIQVFPGMVGLPEPWAGRRSTPLTHSLCRHVVRTAQPLVVSDTREDPLVWDNLAVPDLGVIAYAGMPLTDQDGRVLGSLCAIDHVPRSWTAPELRTLARIARACCLDLRLRLSRFDSGVESLRRDATELVQQGAYERTQTLLLALRQFTDTTSVEDVAARIAGLVTSALHPTVISTVLVEDGTRLRRLHDLDPQACRTGSGSMP